ncbi:hypothetical protein GCM10010303_83580 [Streptomyces purpurascens]|nr:hypothetical protein GCM10010303_83580 [Streptomyces purpurascens]
MAAASAKAQDDHPGTAASVTRRQHLQHARLPSDRRAQVTTHGKRRTPDAGKPWGAPPLPP